VLLAKVAAFLCVPCEYATNIVFSFCYLELIIAD
jgi:hypothetical protein